MTKRIPPLVPPIEDTPQDSGACVPLMPLADPAKVYVIGRKQDDLQLGLGWVTRGWTWLWYEDACAFARSLGAPLADLVIREFETLLVNPRDFPVAAKNKKSR